MLRKRICEARFEWSLKCEGPFLIKDGRFDKKDLDGNNELNPNGVFISRESIQTVKARVHAALGDGRMLQGLSYYVPGTSLRGAFRSRAELILRSLLSANGEGEGQRTACDPFEKDPGPLQACSHRMAEKEPEPSPYADACPACKLFGCTATASRISFEDADIEGAISSIRDYVGIDRFSGGAFQGTKDEPGSTSGGAKMRLHVLENSSFTTTVTVRNFELWQLGLLAYVFRDFEDGRVPLGFGSKAKGFGRVKGKVTGVTLEYVKGQSQAQHLAGLGSLLTAEEFTRYGLKPDGSEALPLQPAASAEGSLLLPSLYQSFTIPNLQDFWRVAADSFGKLHLGVKAA